MSPVNAEPSIDGIAAIYSAERSDNQNILASALALMAAGVAYIAFTLDGDGVSRWTDSGLVFVLPLPLLMIVAYQTLLITLSGARSLSGRILERELLKSYDPAFSADYIGERIGELVMHPKKMPKLMLGATLLTYGGEFAIILGYSIHCWHEGFESDAHSCLVWLGAGIAYLIAFATIVGSLISGTKLLSDAEKAVSGSSANPPGPASPPII